MIPQHTKEAIDRWVNHGLRPGSFLTAVITNDLVGACQSADEVNRYALFDIVSYLYNDCPSECWKSWKNFHIWESRFQSDPNWQIHGITDEQRSFEDDIHMGR